MSLIKNIMIVSLCISLLGMVGCSSKNTGDSKIKSTMTESNMKIEVSEKKPIIVDKNEKSVTVLSKVNGKYFTEPTRHASVEKSGSNGNKSIFTAYVTPEQLYNGLIEIGAKAGDNMSPDNAKITHVEGSKLTATVTWNGADKAYDINDVINDSNGNKIDFRFGGNLERAKTKMTGCLSCLDSCPVGIVSNTTYTYGAVEKRKEVEFTANKDVLPEDGTFVAITYKLVE